MRKLITTIAMAGALSMSAMSAANAAPVPGFEALYESVLASCAPPAGTPAACEAAINAYSAALVAAGVEPEVALASFTALRSEVAAAGGGDLIEALFEELLPESGAVPSVGAGPAPVPDSAGGSGEAPAPTSASPS